MVTRLADPRLVVSSMSGGNTTSENFAMTAPGSAAVQPAPQTFELLDLAEVAQPAGRIASRPEQPGSGRFVTGPADQTGGWTQVQGQSR